jgi:hypothetical protein
LSLLGNAKKCENLLQMMYDDFTKRGNLHAEPNVACFTITINSLANHQKILGLTSTAVTSSQDNRQASFESGKRAEAILRRMQELHNSGELSNAEPNAYTYSSVLQCWANTRSREAGERAETILREMEEKSKDSGRVLVSTAAYSAVLQAYAGAGDAKSAEAFLGRLIKIIREKTGGTKPVVEHLSLQNLTILLSAWARSNDPQAPLRAEGESLGVQSRKKCSA